MAGTVIAYDRELPEVPGRTPYTKPDSYLEKLGEGRYEVKSGRRPSTMFLVNKLRAAVDAWRDRGYRDPDISDVTRRLFQYWFEDDHLLADGSVWRYWWCQREAVETLVYLLEARGFADLVPALHEFGEQPKLGMLEMDFSINTTMDGERLLHRWLPEIEKEAEQPLPEERLLRYAFKMATGTGKTEVMALAVVWSCLHRRLVQGSPLADNFLIVAPNVIVYERLARDFASGAIFHQRPLIPPEWRSQWNMKVILRGDSALPDPGGNLFLTNIQQLYESRGAEWTPTNAVDAILGQPAQQDITQEVSMLERIKGLGNLMVLNDEAHHVHDDELKWNQTLLALHGNLARGHGTGLTAWLDFSATPKTQAGTYFPWTITDYPLAQAIEDEVVKAPLIVHRVRRADPSSVSKDTVWSAYHDWIAVALERWREHARAYRDVGQKPVLFIMCERTSYADELARHVRRYAHLKEQEVLVIHTDTKGNITKKDLDMARAAARDVDDPESPIKVIVSVLMLREGWDVRNVTVVLGLRPFTAKADILPEQAVGRGLRVMPGVSPDRRQTLEVIGTEAFEAFVRELEHEGVGIVTVTTPPPSPVTIYPVLAKARYDIAIPLTKLRYAYVQRNLQALDVMSLAPIYDADVLEEQTAIEIKLSFATTGTTVHQTVITPERPLLSQDVIRDIAQAIGRRLNLEGHFAELCGIVKRYMRYRCFGVEVDTEADDIKRRLREPELQEGIVAFLSREIAKLSREQREVEFEDAAFRLSQTAPFHWRRQHLPCEKTIFFECAVYNNLEARFAQFLDAAPDVDRFAALAESYTRFRVDYLSANGAIKLYYPDFVVVQTTTAGEVNWIIETKGREFENVAEKDASIRDWCGKVSAQTGQSWRYLKVPQAGFDSYTGAAFAGLVQHLEPQEAPPLLASEDRP